VTTPKADELAQECRRLSEACLYTSTSFFIWLKFLRGLRVVFVIVPLTLGALATWQILTASLDPGVKTFVAIAALISGVMPSIYAALKIDDHLGKVAPLAAEFKNLQDRFRQAALVASKKGFAEFEGFFGELMDRLERARVDSVTPPDFVFSRARRKIKQGHYAFDSDETNVRESS